MSTPISALPLSYSDSSDSMIVEAIGPTDFVPRPATGKLLEIGIAEREKLERYRKEQAERERIEKANANRTMSEKPPKPDA
jgi:hypothetical protein